MRKKLMVSVADEVKVGEVARQLARAGMTIDEKDDTFRLVTGSVEANKLESLKRVRGVRHVEEQRIFEAPERDAAVQ